MTSIKNHADQDDSNNALKNKGKSPKIPQTQGKIQNANQIESADSISVLNDHVNSSFKSKCPEIVVLPRS